MNEAETRLANEVAFHADVASRERSLLRPTPAERVARYRLCRRWRTRYPECVIRFLTQGQPEHIGDFGCGSGEMACLLGLLGYRVTGIDVSPDLIELARSRAVLDGVADRVTFIQADGASDDLTAGKFDAVLAMSVIHHMPLFEALSAIERLLKPGGYVAILEPVAYSPALQWIRDRSFVKKEVTPDERQLSSEEIEAIRSRFEVVDLRHFYVAARLQRIVPNCCRNVLIPLLEWLDRGLLLLPGMDRFSGLVTMRARSRR